MNGIIPEPRISQAAVKRRRIELVKEAYESSNQPSPEEIVIEPVIEDTERDCQLEQAEIADCTETRKAAQTDKFEMHNKYTYAYLPTNSTNRGTQTYITYPTRSVSIGLQTDTPYAEDRDEEEEAEQNDVNNKENDPDFLPSDAQETDDEPLLDAESRSASAGDRIFLIFESCLLLLFRFCFICRAPIRKVIKVNGSLLLVETLCDNMHRHIWKSQPVKNKRPKGNLILASSIFFSGLQIQKVLRMLKNAGVQVFGKTSFQRLQDCYILPSIHNVWKEEQQRLFQNCLGEELSLSGDGRCDSPGYCANYGTYSLLDMKTNKVIAIEVVQSNEVQSSMHMEKEGLKQCLHYLFSNNLNVSTLITDRHIQIRKFLKEHHTDIKHTFDSWHVVKSLKKKLSTAAKKKNCAIISFFVESITNHLYWCAATSGDDSKLKVAKWLSLLNHIRFTSL